MKTIDRRRVRIVRLFAVGWMAGFVFLSIVRGVGTIEEGAVQMEFGESIAVSLLLGLLFGGLAGMIQIVFEERLYRRLSLWRLLAARVGLTIASLAVLVGVAYVLVTTFFDVSIDPHTFVSEPGSLALYFYIVSVDVLVQVFRQLDLMLGEGNLWMLVRGRFYTPRSEERIFMFLDLRSSTALAEELGHIDYSMLIQDCFDDLAVMSDYGAQVYQYVGDGVVLTWPVEAGLRSENCLRAYFSFARRLESRHAYYATRYGTQPFFTAGLNAGTVTVTEVGRHKREIAYHGDTLNTAARVQAECSTFGADLLIVEPLRDRMGTADFNFTALGHIALRGKEQDVAILAVTRPLTPAIGTRP